MNKNRRTLKFAALLLAVTILGACASKPTEQKPAATEAAPPAVEQVQPAAAPPQAEPAQPAMAEAPAPAPAPVVKKHKKHIRHAVAPAPKVEEPAPVVEPAPAPAPPPAPVAQPVSAPPPVVTAPVPHVEEKGLVEQYWMWLVGLFVVIVGVVLVAARKKS